MERADWFGLSSNAGAVPDHCGGETAEPEGKAYDLQVDPTLTCSHELLGSDWKNEMAVQEAGINVLCRVAGLMLGDEWGAQTCRGRLEQSHCSSTVKAASWCGLSIWSGELVCLHCVTTTINSNEGCGYFPHQCTAFMDHLSVKLCRRDYDILCLLLLIKTSLPIGGAVYQVRLSFLRFTVKTHSENTLSVQLRIFFWWQ